MNIIHIGVTTQLVFYSDLKSFDDLNPKMLEQIDAFFTNYQKVRGIKFKVLGHSTPKQASHLLTHAMDQKPAA